MILEVRVIIHHKGRMLYQLKIHTYNYFYMCPLLLSLRAASYWYGGVIYILGTYKRAIDG